MCKILLLHFLLLLLLLYWGLSGRECENEQRKRCQIFIPFFLFKKSVILVKKDCSRIDSNAGGGQGLMAVLMQSFSIQRQACKPGEVLMTAWKL